MKYASWLPKSPGILKNIKQLANPSSIKGDAKHIDGLRQRLIDKFVADGSHPEKAWDEAMKFDSVKKMYEELGMHAKDSKKVVSNPWTGTKAASVNSMRGFWEGFEKRANG